MAFLSWMASSFISFPESLLWKWRAPCKSQRTVSVFPLMWPCWLTGFGVWGDLSESSSEFRAHNCWDGLRQMLKPQLSQGIILRGSQREQAPEEPVAEAASVLAHETCFERDVWDHLLSLCWAKSIEQPSVVMGGPLLKWSPRRQGPEQVRARVTSHYRLCENRKCKCWVSHCWTEVRRRQQTLLMGLTCSVEKPRAGALPRVVKTMLTQGEADSLNLMSITEIRGSLGGHSQRSTLAPAELLPSQSWDEHGVLCS